MDFYPVVGEVDSVGLGSRSDWPVVFGFGRRAKAANDGALFEYQSVALRNDTPIGGRRGLPTVSSQSRLLISRRRMQMRSVPPSPPYANEVCSRHLARISIF